MPEVEVFADHDRLADAAAGAIAQALAQPDARGFFATGGTTPWGAYDRLSKRPLDWGRIAIAPTDERFVDVASPDSNERLLREHLLVGEAARARFTSLRGDAATPEAAAVEAEPRIATMLPVAATLLGMGADGHVGSLFPGDPDLAARLDPHGERLCVGVPLSSEKPILPRVTLTIRALLASRLIVILVTGEPKRQVLQRIADDPAYAPPVATILRQVSTPVRILWAA